MDRRYLHFSGGVTAFLLALVFTGCDANREQSANSTDAARQNAETGGAADKTDARNDNDLGFELPKVDVSVLPSVLEMKIGSARTRARNEPMKPEPLTELGALYFTHNYYQAALACFAEAFRIDGSEKRWRWAYYAGLAAERAEDYRRALAAYEQVLALREDYAPAFARSGNLLVRARPSEARPRLERALELNPDDALSHFNLGRLALSDEDLATAKEHLETAVRLAPNFGEAHRALGEVLTTLGQSSAANQHLNQAEHGGARPEVQDPLLLGLRRAGLDAAVLASDAILLATNQMFSQADEKLGTATEIAPDAPVVLNARGVVRALQGRYDEAVTAFQSLLKRHPNDVATLADLAYALAQRGDNAEAEQHFRRALELAPNDPLVVRRFAAYLESQGRADEARDKLQTAIAHNPDEAELHYLLGDLLFKQGDLGSAAEALTSALEQSPQHVRARFLLGEIRRQQGDMVAAREQWEQTIQSNPRFLDGYAGLAAIHLDQNETAEAERIFQAGLEHLPNAPTLLNGLAWIRATHPDAEHRNGQQAVQLAQRACELTDHQHYGYLDTLAAAYAEMGNYREAVRVQRKVLQLLDQSNFGGDRGPYQERLQLYEVGRPYHDVR